MKRSELNEVFRNRLLFSSQYDAFSIEENEEGESKESYFSSSGCEVCNGLPGSVYPCKGLSREEVEKKNFEVFEFEICNSCLVSLVNGDDSDLDYYCTEEDSEDLREAIENLRFEKSHYHYLDENEEELTLDSTENEEKYFYYFGLPGCLPDSDFFGPFDSYFEALENALELFFDY